MQASDECKNITMWFLWSLYIVLSLAVSLGRSDGPMGQGYSSLRVESLLSKMTIEDKVGQMTQLDIGVFVSSETGELNEQKLTDWVTRYRIGSLFNTPFAGQTGSWSADKWRRMIRRVQQIASGAGSKLPLLVGLDSVHGANYVQGAVIFPQQIALAATFNPSLAARAGRVAARDSRAAAVPWLFAPILGIATQPLWPRVYETFGEDPVLASVMGAAIVRGIQASMDWDGIADDGEPLRAAACMKHFVGYSHPTSGHDRSPSRIPDQELLELYLPPFRAAVEAGVSSAMESYNELNGVPVATSRRYLVDVLRGHLGFLGMLVTDYAEIANLEHHHMVSKSPQQSVYLAMEDTSIDMSMTPLDASFAETLLGLVKAGRVSKNRIDRSVRRILALKESLGLLDSPVPAASSPLLGKVGGKNDQRDALQAARESITLLKNGDMPTRGTEQEQKEGEEEGRVSDHGRAALPLKRSETKKLLVVGPACNSLELQSGGWTKHWQGAFSANEFGLSEGRTILSGIRGYLDGSLEALDIQQQQKGGDSGKLTVEGASDGQGEGEDATPVEVVYKAGVHVDGTNDEDRDSALSEAFSADAIVACVGEDSYTEKRGDLLDLDLPEGVMAFVKELRRVTDDTTPLVLVLVEGRPRLLGDLPRVADAILHTYLMGPWGGQAVAEVLFGAQNPSGRLPITYPRHSGNIPLPYHRPVSELCQNRDLVEECEVEWWFGEGLSYTNFEYTALRLEPDTIEEGDSFTVSVTVKNAGSVSGDDAVLLFATDVVRRVTPRYKLLKAFDKVSLHPGDSKEVSFTLSSKDLEYVGLDLRPVLEAGVFLFGVGPSSDCRSDPDSCVSLNVALSDDYQPACEAACDLWYPPDYAAPGGYVCPREAARAFRNRKACLEECIETQWGWGYVSCLEQAVWTGTCAFNQQCRAVGSDAIIGPQPSSGDSGNNSTSYARIGRWRSPSTLRPRAGSVDLALGVGVGMFIGGAAVFVLLVTVRNRRLNRSHQQTINGGGAGGFGYDGVRLHGSGTRVRGGGGGSGGSWSRRRSSFPMRSGKAAAKQVAIELGRGGFDYGTYSNEEEAFESLTIEKEGRRGGAKEDQGAPKGSGELQSAAVAPTGLGKSWKDTGGGSGRGRQSRNGRGKRHTPRLSTHSEYDAEAESQQALLGARADEDGSCDSM